MGEQDVWLVRADGKDRGGYFFYFGSKPERARSTGQWPRNIKHVWDCATQLELLIPKHLRPKSSGDAVKVKVVRG